MNAEQTTTTRRLDDNDRRNIRLAAQNLAEVLSDAGIRNGHLLVHGIDLESAKAMFPGGYREVERGFGPHPSFQVWVGSEGDGLKVTLFCGPVS